MGGCAPSSQEHPGPAGRQDHACAALRERCALKRLKSGEDGDFDHALVAAGDGLDAKPEVAMVAADADGVPETGGLPKEAAQEDEELDRPGYSTLGGGDCAGSSSAKASNAEADIAPPTKGSSKKGAGAVSENSLMDRAGSKLRSGMHSVVSHLSNISQQVLRAATRARSKDGAKNSGEASFGAASSSASGDLHEDGTFGGLLRQLRRRPSLALQIIIENPRRITDCYNVEEKELGHGAFGSVRKARVTATGAVRAVKFISKVRMKGQEAFLRHEIEILKALDHPNIVKLYELFEDADNIYLVMELCSGGSLHDHLRRDGRFTEMRTAKAMVQVFRAVYYLHAKEIVHRDIKPANCLFVTRERGDKQSLRVTDFGLSCRCAKGQLMTQRVGTLAFMAPQVIARSYDHTCDVWSCGVMMFVLLSGSLPFKGKGDDEIRKKVSAGFFTFTPSEWLDTSEQAMALIRKLMRADPTQRCTIGEALQSVWLRHQAAEVDEFPIDDTMLRNLRGFRSLNKFKRAALCVIASLLDEDQIQEARDFFIALDTDEDGTLDHAELRARADDPMLSTVSEDVFCRLDPEPYTYTEFVAATFDRRSYCQRGICWAAFNAFDSNQDGTITTQELSSGGVLGKLSKAEVERLVQDFDANGDGGVDFQEFMAMMRDGEGWTPSPSRRSSRSNTPGSSVCGSSRPSSPGPSSLGPSSPTAAFSPRAAPPRGSPGAQMPMPARRPAPSPGNGTLLEVAGSTTATSKTAQVLATVKSEGAAGSSPRARSLLANAVTKAASSPRKRSFFGS